MSEWLEWIDIEKNPDYKGYGVHKLRLVSSKGLPIKIPRFLGNDKDGTLYIGHTENIKRRIKLFRGSLRGKQYSCTEGQRLYLIIKFTSYIENYSNFKVQYSFKRLVSKREAKLEKERSLECYFERYGEVPPLNNNKSLYDIFFRQNINIIPISGNRLPVQMLEEENLPLYPSGKLSDFREKDL